MITVNEVLDTQSDLAAWFDSSLGKEYMVGFKKALGEKFLFGLQPYNIADVERFKLIQASPICVKEEIMDLLVQAGSTFPFEEIMYEDLLCDSGFVLLPRPFIAPDEENNGTISIRAFAWMLSVEQKGDPVPNGIYVSLYTHKDDPYDYDKPIHRFPKEGLSNLRSHYYVPSLTPMHVGVIPLNVSDSEEGFVKSSSSHFFKFVQAFFRLAQEEILVQSKEQADRHTRKRAKRNKIEPQDITVITLRRPRHRNDEEDSREVEWTQQWLVRGHWRRIWKSSENRHKHTWVRPYVKGPEDKPLIIKKTGYSFSR